MRRLAKGVIPSAYEHAEGAKSFFGVADGLEDIRPRGDSIHEAAARATSRTRKRGQGNNVSACFS